MAIASARTPPGTIIAKNGRAQFAETIVRMVIAYKSCDGIGGAFPITTAPTIKTGLSNPAIS